MIRSLRIGKIEGIDALVELVGEKEILLERVQSKPDYYSEEFAFNQDGSIKGIMRSKDLNGSAENSHRRLKLELHVLDDKCKIRYATKLNATDDLKKGLAKHSIEVAYQQANKFYSAIKRMKVSPNEEDKRKEIEKKLEIITKFDPMHYFFFEVEW